MNEYFAAANTYHNLGFNVTCINSYNYAFKNDYLRDNDFKTPGHEWEIYINRKQEIETLFSFNWEVATGVGIVLGYKKIRALNIDDCKNDYFIARLLKILNLPANYQWVTQSGSLNGFHILFYADELEFEQCKKGNIFIQSNSLFREEFSHIELRWFGNLVLPPSKHYSGNNYSFKFNKTPTSKPLTVDIENIYSLLREVCAEKHFPADYPIFKYSPDNYAGSSIYLDESHDILHKIRLNDITNQKVMLLSSDYDYGHIFIDPINYYPPYYLFFHTETTGKPFDNNQTAMEINNWPRLIQLSWILSDQKGTIINRKNRIIKPNGFIIPQIAVKMYGINTKYAETCGFDIKEVFKEFHEQLSLANVIITHNLELNLKLIDSENIRLNESPLIDSDISTFCTMRDSVELYKILGNKEFEFPTLDELFNKLFNKNIENCTENNSYVDAIAHCFWEINKRVNITF